MPNIRPFGDRFPRIAHDAWVDEAAVVIGDVTIGARSSIWPMAVLRGDVNKIRIGTETNIQDGSVLHVTHDGPDSPGGVPLIIGSRVTVGHQATLHACEIQDNCFIGMGSTIMDGAVLEPNVMLAARSLVTPGKRLEGGFLWMGTPARRARKLTDDELEHLKYSAAHYVRLMMSHRGQRF